MDSTTISLFSQVFRGSGRDCKWWSCRAQLETPLGASNDFDTSAAILCETYRRRWQIETLYKRLKQNFPLKYFLGDNKNAIQIQIWVNLIAWLLMQVIKKNVKRKWSLSNMMTAVRILLNSYVGLYAFLELPEGQWIGLIQNRQEKEKTQPPQIPTLYESENCPPTPFIFCHFVVSSWRCKRCKDEPHCWFNYQVL